MLKESLGMLGEDLQELIKQLSNPDIEVRRETVEKCAA